MVFNAFLNAENIDIFIGCETFLNDSISDAMISSEHKIYKKNRTSCGGGVIIGIKNNLKSLLVNGFNSDTFESMAVEILFKNVKVIFISVYIPPKPNQIQLLEFDNLLNFIATHYSTHNLIISGDFNLNFLDSDQKHVKMLKNVLKKFGLSQLVKTFTYPSSPYSCVRKSLIDLFIVNDKNLINSLEVRESIALKCDHLSINCNLNIISEKPKPKVKYILDLNESDIETFKTKLENINWDSLMNTTQTLILFMIQ